MNCLIVETSLVLLGYSMLLGGCYTKGMRLDEDLLSKSTFYVYDENCKESSCSWEEFDNDVKQQILLWLPCVLEGAKPSLVTYAPALIIKTNKYNVNITGKEIVCNVEVSDKKWLQYVRDMNSVDRKIQEIIRRKFEGRK